MSERALQSKKIKMQAPPQHLRDLRKSKDENDEQTAQRHLQLLSHFKAMGLIPFDFDDFPKFQSILNDPMLYGILQAKVRGHLEDQQKEISKKNALIPQAARKFPS